MALAILAQAVLAYAMAAITSLAQASLLQAVLAYAMAAGASEAQAMRFLKSDWPWPLASGH